MQSVSTTMSMHSTSRLLPSGISFQNNTPASDSSTIAEFAKDFVIILLLGTVGLICLMLITYLLTILMDRLSPYYFSQGTGDQGEATPAHGISPLAAARAAEAANRDIGTLTRKAHLWGLHVDERESVLHAFFQKRVRIMGQSDPELVRRDGDIEMGDQSSLTPTLDSPSEAPPSDSENIPQLTEDASLDATDMQGTCCICLLPYEAGEAVMTGTQCGHLYHFDCCQAWLAQHDHCPYCRQEMLRPAEFRQAAEEVLGEARVNQLLTQHYHLAAPTTIPPVTEPTNP